MTTVPNVKFDTRLSYWRKILQKYQNQVTANPRNNITFKEPLRRVQVKVLKAMLATQASQYRVQPVRRVEELMLLGLTGGVGPGPIGGGGGGGGGLDPIATDWRSRVIANGGTDPGTVYTTVISNLVAGLKTDGIWSKMIIINGYVPGPVVGVNPPITSCYAPLTPILVGPGHDPWLHRDGTSIAAAMPTDGQTDITINGFQGYNDTPKVFPNAIWASGFNLGFSFYVYAFSPANNSIIGMDDYNTPHAMRLIAATGGTGILDCGAQSDFVVPNAVGAGLLSVNRAANNDLKVFIASSTVVPAALFTNSTVDNTDPRATAFDFWIHGCNDPAGGNIEKRNILSFAACHQALTLGDFTSLYNRVQAFRTAIGGGFV